MQSFWNSAAQEGTRYNHYLTFCVKGSLQPKHVQFTVLDQGVILYTLKCVAVAFLVPT